jgi:PelA/Pel-15E family pectate lyase
MKARNILTLLSLGAFSLPALVSAQAPATDKPQSFRQLVRTADDRWFSCREAQNIADTLLAYQFPSGGWPKNHKWNNLLPGAAEQSARAELKHAMRTTGIGATIDNRATTLEMLYLARAYKALRRDRYRESFMRGLNYLLAAQYPGGGWPQFYPFKPDHNGHTDYSVHITFNDDAIVNVMTVLRAVADNQAPYDALRLPETLRKQAAAAFDRGVGCILQTQIRNDRGERTVWCQQYDTATLQPAGARAYELPSYTGCNETVSILQLLMSLPNPSDEVVQSVSAAVTWLRNHAIHDQAIERFVDPEGQRDYRLTYQPGAPLLWARYYDLETEQPYYCDRDGIKRADISQIGHERRNGYGWLSHATQEVLDTYPSWLTSVRPGNYVDGDYGYLYCHMSGNGEWTAYALSRDGYHYHDLINGDSIFSPTELAGIEGGTRDAYICRRHDGRGYLMVTTDMANHKSRTWFNYGINLLTSDDLIHWRSTTFDFRRGAEIFSDPTSPDIYRDYSTVQRVWAPQIIWDANYRWADGHQGGYMIYYSLWNPKEYGYDRMYYSYADTSFTTLTKPRLLFDWGYATIDADINYVAADGLYHMMIKKEGGQPGIFTATAPTLTGPWSEPVADDYVNFEGNKKCEGVSAFQLIGDSTWRVAYIEYSSKPRHYRICKADAHLRNFSSPVDIEGVNGPQHGSFLRLNREEYERLQAWSDSLEAEHVQPNAANPLFPGLYADPEVLYSEQTGRYYIYPTTDGAIGWRSHDFHAFSSADLKTWQDEGVVFDLRSDCPWADEYAWAPCIIERRYPHRFRKATYRYYYYYVADKKIGVAVADRPEGPFRDALGHPLLSERPEGAKGGQVIDPDVFRDPASGKYYLYWGNSYLAVSELNDDMISIREGSTRLLIPREEKRKYHYNEGTYVFYRDGKYYFMWSENDTRRATYQVRYLISDSPVELTNAVSGTVVLQQNPALGIYGTGHHAVFCKPSTDEWYIVYHRFARPDAIKLGRDAGYHREVCMDRLEFDSDGNILPVRVSL